MIDLYKNLPTLDLHGETKEISTVLINDFIEDNYKMKNKKVIIIHFHSRIRTDFPYSLFFAFFAKHTPVEKNGKIYDRLHIRAWKDFMPDMSRVMKDMVPKRVGIAPTSEKMWILVRETCRAELVHWGLCLLSPVIFFFWWNLIGVLLSLLVIFCNLPFILIQRYNRPAFVSLARRLEAREEKKRNANLNSLGEHGGRT